jgi:hypothetical protein
MAAIGDSCFWLADFLNSSPLKPLGQMNRNLVGSIYKDCLFRPDPLTNMAATSNSCFSTRKLKVCLKFNITLLLLINTRSEHLCHSDVMWWKVLFPRGWFIDKKTKYGWIKVEKDTGQKKTSQWIFLNFIYIVLWDVPNKISKFENRFRGLF